VTIQTFHAGSWKHLALVLLVLALFACTPGSTPLSETPEGSTGNIPQAASTPTRTPGHTIVQVYSENGDLKTLLKEEAVKAQALGQKPFALFTAGWCAPCRKLEKSFSEAMVKEAIEGIYIIELDIDDWDPHLGGAGFRVEGIPLIFRLDSEGRPSGKPLGGNEWGEDTPGNIAPVLKAFFDEEL